MSAYLELKGITKLFGEFVANENIDLEVNKGTIHAIIGENGAGKSTLMNVLSGIYQPDGGDIFIDGKPKKFKNPTAANKAGIGMVYQEFMLFPELTVLENIIMGYEKTRAFALSEKRSRKAVEEICEKYSFRLPLNAAVNTLPVAVLQQVEIVKVLYHGADIIIFDEPTSVLTPHGIEGLFRAFRALTEKGKTILFITHKLNEVMKIADEITVLKGGRVVYTTKPAETSEKELAKGMVGREVFLSDKKTPKKLGAELLCVNGLTVLGENGIVKVDNVSFSVKAGEILGIAGIAGSGENELISSLVGIRPVKSGTISYCGKAIEHMSVRNRRKAGIGYVPQDRNAEGVNSGAPLWENCLMGYHVAHDFKSRVFIDRKDVYDFSFRVIDQYSVKTSSMFSSASELSGGNVQKLIVGREFLQGNRLLIIEDPTRGIDVGAIEFIWSKIEELAHEGVAVIMVSHELNEVMTLSDRILVMNNGRLLDGGLHGEHNEEEIGLLMLNGGESA